MARMVSLLRSDADRIADFMPAERTGPNVDAGMCICFNADTLEKLGLDDDVEPGDLIHLMVMVQATAVHKDDNGCRIEAAIIAGRAEDEMTEGMDDDEEEEEGE